VDDDPLPLRILELRRQIAELSGTIQHSGAPVSMTLRRVS
jgi:hypothetical protein